MSTSKTNEIDMLHGSLYGKMLLFMVPLMLSSALQLLFNAADVVVVGRYAGADALAAVGAASYVVAFVVNFFVGFTSGINYVVARNCAIGDRERISKSVHTSAAFSIIFGIVVGICGIGGVHGILNLMGTPENIYELTSIYVIVYFIGLPGIAVYNAGAAILRSTGDTKRPMYYLTAAGILNLVLNLFFVIVMKLGVIGVAAATSISNYLAAGMVWMTLCRHEGSLRLELRKLVIDRACLKEIMGMGFPTAVQSSMFGITNLLIQAAVNSFGSVTIAGFATASNLESFLYVIPSSASTAVLTFMSQNVGAGKYSRANMVLRTGVVIGASITLAMGILWAIFRYPMLGLYTTNADVIQVAADRVIYMGPLAFMENFMQGYSAAIRGLGHARAPMLASVICICGFRVLWVMTIFRVLHTTLVLILSWPLSWVLITFVFIVMYRIYRGRCPKGDAELS